MARSKNERDHNVCAFCGRGARDGAIVVPGPDDVGICSDCARTVVEMVDAAEAELNGTAPARSSRRGAKKQLPSSGQRIHLPRAAPAIRRRSRFR